MLKDASAGAIYGTRAAGGVILITTKRAKQGSVTANYTGEFSFETVRKYPELLSSSEYIEYGLGEDYGADTDWYKELTNDAPFSQRHTVSIAGGTEVAQVYTSFMAQNQKGIVIGDNRKDYSGRVNARFNLFDGVVEVRANAQFREAERDNRNSSGIFKMAFGLNPTIPLYDPANPSKYNVVGNGISGTTFNPVADIMLRTKNGKDQWLLADATVKINLMKGLSLQGTVGIDKRQYQEYTYVSHDHKESIDNSRRGGASHKFSKDNRVSVEAYANYHRVFREDHTLDVVAGYSFWQAGGEDFSMSNYDFPVDGVGPWDMGVGSYLTDGRASMDSNKDPRERLLSMFGRANYSYKDRYMATVSFRREGSSKFGVNNRWGCFPSVAVGWRISEEAFYPKDFFINSLKFRASWGRLGNENALGYYDFQALILSRNNRYGGYIQGGNAWPMENRGLKWETTDTKNIGFDFGMLSNKLTGSINYYINQTEDLLITKRLSPSAGYQNPILNVGKIRNNGVELEVNWTDKIKDFEYNVGFNFSTTKNKVVELADKGQALPATGLLYDTDHIPAYAKEGKPISGFYLYRTDGIFQSDAEAEAWNAEHGTIVIVNGKEEWVGIQPNAKAGDIRFKDLDNNGVLDEDDKEYCGTGIPKFETNLNFSASYKGFDLSFSLSGVFGHKIYNGNRYFYESMNAPLNMLSTVANAWTPENTHTDIPRAVNGDPNGNSRESERFLENGSFVRLRQAQIGYTLPVSLLKKVKIEKLRFYISGDNLFTITGYSGVDPEFSTSSPLNSGVDRYIYPFTRSYTVGAQLTF